MLKPVKTTIYDTIFLRVFSYTFVRPFSPFRRISSRNSIQNRIGRLSFFFSPSSCQFVFSVTLLHTGTFHYRKRSLIFFGVNHRYTTCDKIRPLSDIPVGLWVRSFPHCVYPKFLLDLGLLVLMGVVTERWRGLFERDEESRHSGSRVDGIGDLKSQELYRFLP